MGNPEEPEVMLSDLMSQESQFLAHYLRGLADLVEERGVHNTSVEVITPEEEISVSIFAPREYKIYKTTGIFKLRLSFWWKKEEKGETNGNS